MRRSIIRIPPPSDPVARVVEINAQEALERGESPAPAPLQPMPLSGNVPTPNGPSVLGLGRTSDNNQQIRRLSVSELVETLRHPELTDDRRAAFDKYRRQELESDVSAGATSSLQAAEAQAMTERVSRATSKTKAWKSFLSRSPEPLEVERRETASGEEEAFTSDRLREDPILGNQDETMDISNENETITIAPQTAATTTTTTTTTAAPTSSLILRRPPNVARRSSSRIRSRSRTPSGNGVPAPTSTSLRNGKKTASRSNSRKSTGGRSRQPMEEIDSAPAPLNDRASIIQAIANTLPTARQRQAIMNVSNSELESSVYNRAANQTRNFLQETQASRSECFACNTHKYTLGKKFLYEIWRDYEDQIAFEYLTAPDSVINQVVDFYNNLRGLAKINHIDLPYMDHAKWYDHFLIHNLTPEAIRHHFLLNMLGLSDVLFQNAVLAAKKGNDIKDKLDVERVKALNAISNQARHWLQLDVTNINIRTKLFLERASNPANNITTGGENAMSASALNLPLTFRVQHSLAEHSKKKATIRRVKY